MAEERARREELCLQLKALFTAMDEDGSGTHTSRETRAILTTQLKAGETAYQPGKFPKKKSKNPLKDVRTI